MTASLVYWWRTTMVFDQWPKVMTIEQTVDHLLETKSSLVRFGDGELGIMTEASVGFQDYSPELSCELRKAIATENQDVLICLPGVFDGMKGVDKLTRDFWIKHLLRGTKVWRSLTLPDRVYGNAFLSRPYMMHSHLDHARIKTLFQHIERLWRGRNVTIVEGINTKFGIGNDLLEGASSIKRILCPNRNAFEKLQSIKEACLEIDRNDLFLVALGPAAKPLVLQLQECGRRAIDVGHLDIEFEWFLRGAKKPSPVPGKAVNEASPASSGESIDNDIYLGQVINTIYGNEAGAVYPDDDIRGLV